MAEKRLAVKIKRGRPAIHGGYSFLIKGELPENKGYILEYLTAARQGLIQDLGPKEADLSTAQIILIDRITSKLGIIRCIEEHIRKGTVLADNDLQPSLKASYLSYNNSLRTDLVALGLKVEKKEKIKYLEDM